MLLVLPSHLRKGEIDLIILKQCITMFLFILEDWSNLFGACAKLL